MRAARLHAGATQLRVEDVPEPKLRPGSVLVRVDAAFVSDFIGRMVRNEGAFTTPQRPFTPGIDVAGVVERVAPDVRSVAPGDRVFGDHHYELPRPEGPPERIFVGNYALLGPQSQALLAEWPDGGYAEKVLLPAACVLRIPTGVTASAAALSRLGWLGAAYGAFRKIDFPPGAVVAVNGASGLIGAGAVLTALALGASKVYAIGRRRAALDALSALNARIIPCTDIAALPAIDIAFTCVNSPDSASLEALLPRLRRYGVFLIVGAPKSPWPIPPHWVLSNDITIRGSSWCERRHLVELLHLIEAGFIDMAAFKPEIYPLERINEAIDAMRDLAEPLAHVAVAPGSGST